MGKKKCAGTRKCSEERKRRKMPEWKEEKHMSEEQEQPQRDILAFEDRPLGKIKDDAELSKDLLRVQTRTAISKEIVERKEDGILQGHDIKDKPNLFYELISEDLTKANLGTREHAAMLRLAFSSNATQALSNSLGIDLTPTQKVLACHFNMVANLSRPKEGWNVWMSKTDKSVRQDDVKQILSNQQEQKKSRFHFW